MICNLFSKGGMDHLTFLHKIIAIMLIYYCQIQVVLYSNFLTLNSLNSFIGYNQLINSQIFRSKEELKFYSLPLTSITLARFSESGDKRLKHFVTIWFSNLPRKIWLLLCSLLFHSLTTRSFLFYEMKENKY